MSKIYGYVRVSTDGQNVENQKMEIENFCRMNKISVDCWIEDVISGTKDPRNRNLGKQIMKNCAAGDLIICTELSRLGRSLLMIMNTLNFFLEKNVKVWTIKDNFRLADDITSKVVSFAFGLAAEIERQLISQRTKTALTRAKQEGIHLGRKMGAKSSYYKLSKVEDYMMNEYKAGRSKTSLAKEFNVCWKTVDTHIKRMTSFKQNDSGFAGTNL